MKLQQLRYVCAVDRCGLNISDAALFLRTSQPGISKQIQLLEAELGIEIFVRQRNRLVGLTSGGKAIIERANEILGRVENLRALASDFKDEKRGVLSVVTTHTQARYMLPDVVKRFNAQYPSVRLTLRQGTPNQIWQLVIDGRADIAIASEPIVPSAALALLPCFNLPRVILTPPHHPLLQLKTLTLKALAEYPIVTYDDEYISHARMTRAFARQGLTPNIVLSATDSNVMKSYVAAGLGVAIIANMAFDERKDRNLRAIDASYLFEPNTIYIGFRRDTYLRRYAYDFIEKVAPQLSYDVVKGSLAPTEDVTNDRLDEPTDYSQSTKRRAKYEQ